MPVLRVLCKDYPQRTLILATTDDALVFKAIATEVDHSTGKKERDNIHCLVEFCSLSSVDLTGYRRLCDGHGTLGLIALDGDVFLCVVTGASKAATVRPGEAVWRIDNFVSIIHAMKMVLIMSPNPSLPLKNPTGVKIKKLSLITHS